MAKKQTITGKAFEYACLKAIKTKLSLLEKPVSIQDSKQFRTALNAYESLSDEDKLLYNDAARTAVKMIFPLEPALEFGNGLMLLGMNADAAGAGVSGDVRDVLCIRTNDNWEIGFSCKHNHEALKHPRITEAKDFGSAWLGYPCSRDFIDKMSEIIDPLTNLEAARVLWREIDDKQDRFYVPVLQAFLDEFSLICEIHPDAPRKLLSYFFGSQDFYKIISKESSKTTKIIAFNMHDTLCKSSNHHRPVTHVAKLQFPSRLIEAGFKMKKDHTPSKTSIRLTFNDGWVIDMRIHNKDDYAKVTSLAWDVTLAGLPNGIYQSERPWQE